MARTRPQMTIETRAKLIGLALEAFGTRGYAGVALDELTASAGMTRGALYHHFESKLGLFEAVAEAVDDFLDTAVGNATEAAGGGWNGFRAGCRAYLEAVIEPVMQRITLKDAPAVIPNFPNRPRMQLCTADMVQSLATLMDEGAIRRTDPGALAAAVAGAVNNAANWAAAQDDPRQALGPAAEALDRLLDGVMVTPAMAGDRR